jgi:transposase
MSRRPRPRRSDPKTLPPDLLPPDLIARHGLIERLVLAPLNHLTRPRPWARLTDREWEAVAPYLWVHGCGMAAPGETRPGRPLPDPRARLDAIFRGVTLKHPEGGRAPWSALPEEFGKPDTISRTFRRWAAAGLWARLLAEVACPTCPPALKRLTYFICCAFRRAVRVIGREAAIALARRLKLHSALPAPSAWLPDPGLSEIYRPVIETAMRRIADGTGWRPPSGTFALLRSMQRLIAGRARLRRDWEPA